MQLAQQVRVLLQGGFNVLVVEESSACNDVEDCLPVEADHLKICKPTASNDPTYLSLTRRMVDFMKAWQVRAMVCLEPI